MQKILEIINIIGLKKVIIATLSYVTGAILLYFVAIFPFRDIESEQTKKLQQLNDNYIQIKSIRYDELLTALEEQNEYFQRKAELLKESQLSKQAIPHFVSSLEREAVAAGLSIKSTIRRVEPEKKSRKKKKTADLVLTLDFTGTYPQTISFFTQIKKWPNPVYVNSFSLKKLKGNNKLVKGILNCPILEQKSS